MGGQPNMDEIYRKHARMVYSFLLSKGADPDAAEELTQETFYQAYKNLDKFRGDSAVSTWLCGIAGNLWLAHLRKLQKQRAEIRLDETDESGRPLAETAAGLGTAGNGGEENLSAEDVFLRRCDTKDLMKALHRLPEPMREVLYLRLMGDLSFREIGEIMEKSENWARVTYYRGKEKIVKGVSKNE